MKSGSINKILLQNKQSASFELLSGGTLYDNKSLCNDGAGYVRQNVSRSIGLRRQMKKKCFIHCETIC